MPFIYERAFRVRHYECDAYGHVNHANYLRYMQESALDASAKAGFDLAYYDAVKRHWLIRETDITYLRPLTYGDTVVVKTWVADFRRVRSRRAYELRQATTHHLVAQAHTDWVYLDTQTLRPTTIPPEMVTSFLPNGLPQDTPPREPFPKAPPPPPTVFKIRRFVEWRDIDTEQHVNNAMYMAYFEDCGVRILDAYGWPMSRMIDINLGLVARRYRIEYKQSAVMGDELEIATWVSHVKRATAVRHYTMTRVSDNSLLARAHVVWVWINLQSGKPMRIPPDLLADFSLNIVSS